MQKIKTGMLRELFTTIEVNDSERIVYNDDYLHAKDGTPEHALYEIVSDVALNLQVTHDFSYQIVSRAVDVLADIYDNADDTDDIDTAGLAKAVDAIVPVYNHDLLKIATPGNYYHIDEAREVFGNDADTIRACAIAWYSLIDNAAQQVHDAIISHNESVCN